MSHATFDWARRLKILPPYLFAQIDRAKQRLRKKKIKFIDLSIGDPDLFAPVRVIDNLSRAAKIKGNQKYALDQGKGALRQAIAKWMKKEFAVKLNPDTQVLPLIGSKEGLVHLPLGFINPGDYVIIPSPGYPGYRAAAIFAGARVYELPLLEKNGFLPQLNTIPHSIRKKTKLIYLNYPNNPTTALASRKFLRAAVKFCLQHKIILAYDNAYSHIYFRKKPLSILKIKGAQKVAIEFHSFSKTFSMTGFRVAWACGNEFLIKTLLKVKTNIDSGVFGAIQDAATFALNNEAAYVKSVRKAFKARRDLFVSGLKKLGFKDIYAHSGFYVWMKIPCEFSSSIDYAQYLLKEKRIVATPGVGFGKYGEGFIRFALTVKEKELKKALSLLIK